MAKPTLQRDLSKSSFKHFTEFATEMTQAGARI